MYSEGSKALNHKNLIFKFLPNVNKVVVTFSPSLHQRQLLPTLVPLILPYLLQLASL